MNVSESMEKNPVYRSKFFQSVTIHGVLELQAVFCEASSI